MPRDADLFADDAHAQRRLAPVPLPSGWPATGLHYAAGWLPPTHADALLAALMAQIPWETHLIRLFGRLVDAPRLSCWIGDDDAAYTYSGTRFAPRPWPPALDAVREELSAALGVRFNSVLANLYRDGRDRMGWHSDDEPELGPTPTIASLSLGASRRFLLKPRRPPAAGPVRAHALDLAHGSLLVMADHCQRDYRHALAGTARPVPARLNLTFRRILG
jgi:alkylated DNA repair dioxygenase AlkB